MVMPFRTRKVEGVPGNSAPAELNCDALWDQALRPALEDLNDMPIRADCESYRHCTIGFPNCPVGSVASSRACGASAFRHTHSVGLRKILAINAASALGLLLLALQTLVFLAVSGTQGLTALGGVAYATNRRPAQAA